jgi:hypothetical protein
MGQNATWGVVARLLTVAPPSFVRFVSLESRAPRDV